MAAAVAQLHYVTYVILQLHFHLSFNTPTVSAFKRKHCATVS